MIKQFDTFKSKVYRGRYTPLNEEYYAGDDAPSFWRAMPSDINDQEIITKEETKQSDKFYHIIKEIQQFMYEIVGRTGYNGRMNGEWDSLTSECISNWKKNFNYDWESGKEGDKICKSFYKTIVYSSPSTLGILDRCVVDVIQRPQILQKAWEGKDDDNINDWANNYSKNWLSNMEILYNFIEKEWKNVNSFKGFTDTDILNKLYPRGVDNAYETLFPDDSKGNDPTGKYSKILAVLNKIREEDFKKIKSLEKG